MADSLPGRSKVVADTRWQEQGVCSFLNDISCQIDIFSMIWHIFCMSRASKAASGLPPQSQRAIAQLGKDISIARRRRKMPQRLMAERMLVSVQTLQRLEAGDPTVGLAVLASALHVLGMTQRLESVSVGWKRLHRVKKPAGQEWRAARACRPPGNRLD